MKNRGPEIPDYNNAYHYGWEVDLHRLEAAYAKEQRPFKLEDRQRAVDDIIRKNPQASYVIRRCLVCCAAFAKAKLENTDIHAVPEAARIALEMYGFRLRGKQIRRVQKG